MTYALIITVAVGLLLLLLLGSGGFLARRVMEAAERGEAPFGRWRWYPSPLGLLLLLLLPLAALLLWRIFPAFLFIPIIIPFFWRWRRLGRPFFFGQRPGRRPPEHEDDSIEGRYRPLDDQ